MGLGIYSSGRIQNRQIERDNAITTYTIGQGMSSGIVRRGIGVSINPCVGVASKNLDSTTRNSQYIKL